MKIQVYTQRDKTTTLELNAHVFSKNERTKRALIKLFAFLGAALVSILIPVLHFILVPLFVILAPFLAYKTYQEEVILEATNLTCPECHQTTPVSKSSGQWPLHNVCAHCRNRIYFSLE